VKEDDLTIVNNGIYLTCHMKNMIFMHLEVNSV